MIHKRWVSPPTMARQLELLPLELQRPARSLEDQMRARGLAASLAVAAGVALVSSALSGPAVVVVVAPLAVLIALGAYALWRRSGSA